MTKRVVFITGASSGIGRAAALAFVQAGFHVAGTARRADRLAQLEEEIAQLQGEHGNFFAVQADVTQRESLEAAVAQTLAHFGRLDILVANAGVGHRGTLADADWAGIEILLRTNIDGVLHSIQACVPAMRQIGGGHIMIISSVAYNLVSPNAASYAASKAFVSSIAKSLRIELEEDAILVTDFLIGRTETEFNEKRLGEGPRRASSLSSMSAEQVAKALVKATYTPRPTIILRWIDRLIVLGNRLFPSIIGRIAKRQYQ